MSKLKLFCRILTITIPYSIAIVVIIYLGDGFAPMLIWILAPMFIMCFVREIARFGLSNIGLLRSYGEGLWSNSPRECSKAVLALEMVCSARFSDGFLFPFFESRKLHERRLAMWQRWWKENKDLLAWDDTLNMYTTGLESDKGIVEST